MKLRIKGNSLRLRLGPSEVGRLLESGRIEETTWLGPDDHARLVYAVELTSASESPSLCYRPQEITVMLPRPQARQWAESDQVEVTGEIATSHGNLALMIEKDFACLDRNSHQSQDTFPNPKAGAHC